jgi:carbamoyl-phosphate synthase large subunit
LQDAIEVDVDAIADGKDVYIAGIMQHIEEAGIHSGDSACSLPPYSLAAEVIAEMERQTTILAGALNVVGLMNVQYAIKGEDIYILEVNPRASRTVPFVAKATGVPVAKIAARVMAGETLKSFGLPPSFTPASSSKAAAESGHVAVKEAVFPFARFPGVDILLGPEMKSTGEVMGIDADFERAFAKSQLGAGNELPLDGTVFISVKDRDKATAAALAKRLSALGFKLLATGGTQEFLAARGLRVERINKVLEGAPHCVEAITSGGVQLVINTTEGARAIADSYTIRRSALVHNIPHYTTMTGAAAAVGAIEAMAKGRLEVAPLQAYFEPSF